MLSDELRADIEQAHHRIDLLVKRLDALEKKVERQECWADYLDPENRPPQHFTGIYGARLLEQIRQETDIWERGKAEAAQKDDINARKLEEIMIRQEEARWRKLNERHRGIDRVFGKIKLVNPKVVAEWIYDRGIRAEDLE